MGDNRVNRRLAAVISIDVVGYSRLMGEDEEGTLTRLKEIRQSIVDPSLEVFGGRIVKLMGDGALVEFGSVVDAVESAVDIQEKVGACTADSGSIQFRVGINLGDVIIEGDDIYGDGVNVVARIEALAEPGGICISGSVFDQVKDKLEMAFEDLGEQDLKNIKDPVRAYAVRTGDIGGGSSPEIVGVGAVGSQTKPSIAVLPFDNMSNDPEQQYFSDGISEDLTTELSRFEWLFVVARNSAFSFRGQSPDIREVGSQLGVKYVLEGSVRRAGNRVRINAQLIDAVNDRHVWAQRFDRDMEDVFELQDDIVANVAKTVGPEITQAEIERLHNKRTESMDAWEHYLRAKAAFNQMTCADLSAAISHLESAINAEPEFASAYALLGVCHAHIGARGWVRPARDAYDKARQFAEESVRLSPANAEANHALAFVLSVTGHATEAVSVARRALDSNPNFADAYSVLGHALVFCGQLEEGLEACYKAQRSNPKDPRGSWLYDAMGHAYFFLGEYDKAIDISRKGLHQDPSVFGNIVTLACVHAQLGDEAQARRYIDQLLESIPRFSLGALKKNPMFVDQVLVDKLVESMRVAGLPE